MLCFIVRIYDRNSYLILSTFSFSGIDDVHTWGYYLSMRFEWDHLKNQANIKKHKVSFEEAKEVFDDPLHISILDKRFSYFEERWVSIGQSKQHKLLVVANLFFDDSGEEVIRIISAREATVHEQRQYETYG